MKKIIKPHYIAGSMHITIPKTMALESEIFGDKQIEIELTGNELTIRKSVKELSDAIKLIRLFGKSYFIERRREKCKLRREERRRKWKDKLAKIKAQKSLTRE